MNAFFRFVAGIYRWAVTPREKETPTPTPTPTPKPPLQSNADAGFLRLPSEVIHMVADYLAPPSRVLFAQTCHRLRSTVWSVGDLEATACLLPAGELLAFLSVFARDLPDRWVCEICTALHAVDTNDTPLGGPHGRVAYPCGNKLPPGHRYQRGFPRTDPAGIAHRHVQLALKYTRMARNGGVLAHRHRGYLQHLVAPFSLRMLLIVPRSDKDDSVSRESSQPVTFTPKMVPGVDGRLRYLLHSVFRFDKKSGLGLVQERMGELNICVHQASNHRQHEWRAALCAETRGWPEPQKPKVVTGPLFDLARAICGAIDQARRRTTYLSTYTDDAADAANGANVDEVRGSCPRCPTDFAVRASYSAVEIRVWQDLGPEGPATDMAWQIHVRGELLDHNPEKKQKNVYNAYANSPTVHHTGGSVRRLYEGDRRCQDGY